MGRTRKPVLPKIPEIDINGQLWARKKVVAFREALEIAGEIANAIAQPERRATGEKKGILVFPPAKNFTTVIDDLYGPDGLQPNAEKKAKAQVLKKYFMSWPIYNTNVKNRVSENVFNVGIYLEDNGYRRDVSNYKILAFPGLYLSTVNISDCEISGNCDSAYLCKASKKVGNVKTAGASDVSPRTKRKFSENKGPNGRQPSIYTFFKPIKDTQNTDHSMARIDSDPQILAPSSPEPMTDSEAEVTLSGSEGESSDPGRIPSTDERSSGSESDDSSQRRNKSQSPSPRKSPRHRRVILNPGIIKPERKRLVLQGGRFVIS